MTGFIQNYVDCITKKFCKFSGRANRSEYWLFVLANFIVEILLYILMAIIGFGVGSAGGALAIYALIVIYGIAIILPSLGLTVRRLHDSGRGWMDFHRSRSSYRCPYIAVLHDCRRNRG